MTGGPSFDAVWRALAAEQDGVVARRQLIEAGLSAGQARRAVRKQDWRTVFPGVYVTYTGPMTPRARIWAALLAAGQGAVISHAAALYLAGARSAPPGIVDITVPHARHIKAGRGVKIHRADRPVPSLGSPPRTPIEDAVLDVAATSRDARAVIDLVLAVVQQRRTTPARLASALRGRKRQRWRPLIADLVRDAADGVESPLERLHRQRVERPHGLPCGIRDHRQRIRGTTCVWDVDLPEWNTLIELDGLAHHFDESRDRRRPAPTRLDGPAQALRLPVLGPPRSSLSPTDRQPGGSGPGCGSDPPGWWMPWLRSRPKAVLAMNRAWRGVGGAGGRGSGSWWRCSCWGRGSRLSGW